LSVNRETENDSKFSFQVKIPVVEKMKCSRVETAEGALTSRAITGESNQLLKTINMSGVLSDEYSPSKTSGGFKMHKVIKNSSKKLPEL
jgi:hypothetical protein